MYITCKFSQIFQKKPTIAAFSSLRLESKKRKVGLPWGEAYFFVCRRRKSRWRYRIVNYLTRTLVVRSVPSLILATRMAI